MKQLFSLLLASALAFATTASAGGLYTNGLPAATSITGNETIPADTNLPSGANPQTEAVTVNQLRAAMGGDASFSTNTATTATTLTTAQVTGNGQGGFVVVNMSGTLAAGAALTTPTATAWIAAMPNFQAGQSYTLRIINSSAGAFAWTLTAGTDVTITGTATIAQNTFRDFVVTLNSAGTVTVQNVGSGTN